MCRFLSHAETPSIPSLSFKIYWSILASAFSCQGVVSIAMAICSRYMAEPPSPAVNASCYLIISITTKMFITPIMIATPAPASQISLELPSKEKSVMNHPYISHKNATRWTLKPLPKKSCITSPMITTMPAKMIGNMNALNPRLIKSQRDAPMNIPQTAILAMVSLSIQEIIVSIPIKKTMHMAKFMRSVRFGYFRMKFMKSLTIRWRVFEEWFCRLVVSF